MSMLLFAILPVSGRRHLHAAWYEEAMSCRGVFSGLMAWYRRRAIPF